MNLSLKNLKINLAIFLPIVVLYMELILRLYSGEEFFGIGLVYVTLFSASAGLFLQGICSFFSDKTSRIISGVSALVLGVIYIVQIIYRSVFTKYLILYSLKAGGVGQITDGGIMKNTINAIIRGIPAILLLLLPGILIFTPVNRFVKRKKLYWLKSVAFILAAAVIYVGSVYSVSLSPKLKSLQSGDFDPNLSMHNFGLLRTEVLDIKYNLFGAEQKLELMEENTAPVEPPPVYEDEEGNVVEYTPNVMDIDFAALSESEKSKTLKLMNDYFSGRTPTYKNEYTGMYEGYNLIMLVAEGFSPYAIDPVLTPTLYKMQQEGFNFENFYTPVWGVSTSDGEYTACTGLIPKAGVWSFYRSGKNYMPFCLGNMFKSIGMKTAYAYHNNTASYYHRDISHPKMGYNYKGLGTGVEKYVKKVWPQSDLQMVSGSIDEYLKTDEQFHAYYMTVSGHLEYTKIGNSMANKNWSKVKDLDCSHNLKAYYACNIELDLAMEELLRRLEEAGVADKTVIAITPDHYPYGLEQDEGDKYSVWEEMLGHKVETEFELYESTFLLYCPSTKNAPTIEKYCYSVDILPTILHLFGFEYDSRLLMGSDIFSESEGLVIFNNKSYITDKGKYSAKKGVFTPFSEDTFASDEEMKEYAKQMSAIVSNKFKMSAQILEQDYYGYLFGKE